MVRNRALASEGAAPLQATGRPAKGNRAHFMLLWPSIEVFDEKRGTKNGCLSIDGA
jgi:hypothetical protein